MRKQAVKQVFENTEMEVALEALGKSIARWTDKSDRVDTAVPGIDTVSAGRAERADKHYVRTAHLRGRTRGQARAAGR